ncbi:hypothetical protein AB0J63_26945 [Streptosporangium canum]
MTSSTFRIGDEIGVRRLDRIQPAGRGDAGQDGGGTRHTESA